MRNVEKAKEILKQKITMDNIMPLLEELGVDADMMIYVDDNHNIQIRCELIDYRTREILDWVMLDATITRVVQFEPGG